MSLVDWILSFLILLGLCNIMFDISFLMRKSNIVKHKQIKREKEYIKERLENFKRSGVVRK